jgi:hypothetical protein
LIASGGLDRGQHYRSGSGGGRAIDKQHGPGVGNLLGQLRRPLLAGDDADAVFPAESLFDPGRQPRTNAVIPAQRIAAGEDEASELGLGHGKSYKSNRGSFDSLRSLRMTSIE